ncbi:AAA family ATPase [Candidatus Pacearchaeota archaeon]|nr:AAA family ATPase [Candidatus Pacearchaeota archaeon]
MEFISEYIKAILVAFNTYAKENQMIAGAISLWGLGMMSYICKGLPQFLYNLLKRTFTTTVTLTSSNDSFYLLLKWSKQKGYDKKSRFLKVTNGRWGSDELVKSIGYGNHILWYKRCPIYLSMQQEDASQSEKERDKIIITVLGRSHDLINELLCDVIDSTSDKNISTIKKSNGDYWTTSSEQRPRKFNTIYLQEGVKGKLLNHLNTFKEKESWYLEKGIPYQTGILLYGPPGTGKTSIIKAIADYLGYQMHILSSSKLGSIESAMFSLSEKSLVVIEDIDGCNATKKRAQDDAPNDESPKLLEKVDEPTKIEFDLSLANISDILNAIDGISQVHGRILIATTNHIEKLDKALIREGRFDLKIKIDYVDNYMLSNIFDSFFDNHSFPENFNIRDGVSVAYIQNLILKNLDEPELVLEDLKNI